MNDVQAWQATYARHERALARERKAAAAPEDATPKFAEALPVSPAVEPRSASRIAETTPAPAPVAVAKPAAVAPSILPTSSSAPVDVTADQLDALMSAFGNPVEEPIAPVATASAPKAPVKAPVVAAPELTPDQAALLLQSFGIAGHAYGPAETETDDTEDERVAASATAPATTTSTDRFYPVTPSRQAASLDASDVYLSAMRNLDRDLARRGVR